jgi:polysaccharide export outer membrane protein
MHCVHSKSLRGPNPNFVRRARTFAAITGLIVELFALAGCGTRSVSPAPSVSENAQPAMPVARREAEELTLHEGDVVKVAFPGASNLDTAQPIRRDGRIALPIIGEVQAAGLSPTDLSAQLVKLYAPQLVHKEVTVTVLSSSFSVFVSGAVLRPGKIVSDRPLTALEAIMEAGGFDPAKANMKAVVIIRGGRALPDRLDLKRVLDGKEVQPFYLKPSDIVHVPDRLVLF